jgi:hypothetical protein
MLVSTAIMSTTDSDTSYGLSGGRLKSLVFWKLVGVGFGLRWNKIQPRNLLWIVGAASGNSVGSLE